MLHRNSYKMKIVELVLFFLKFHVELMIIKKSTLNLITSLIKI